MSTLWTPGGERPVGGPTGTAAGAAPPSPPSAPAGGDGPDQAQMAADMDELRRQLAEAPAAVVVANHCFGLFELAALHLSVDPPGLDDASLAIDALGLLVDGLTGRLGDAEAQLREAVTQLRFAFVQIRSAATAPPPA